jgi:hypothetical protein
MPLGTFVPKTGNKAGSFKPQDNADKPLIVVPREFRPDFVTKQYPNPKDVVFYDVADLSPLLKGEPVEIVIGVITGSKAIVDQLNNAMQKAKKDGATDDPKLPVKFVSRLNAANVVYYSVEPLDPESKEYQLAVKWESKNPEAIDKARAEKEEADAKAASSNGSGNGNGYGANQNGAGLPDSQPETSAPATRMDDDDLEKAIAAL